MIGFAARGNLKAGRLANWKATALKYWMLEKAGTDTMDATFYCFNGVSFSQVSQNRVRVNLPPEYQLNQTILGPLEMSHG